MSTRYFLLIPVFLLASCALPATVDGEDIANEALSVAKEYLGVPYVWGGQSKKGIDCSGLVVEAYREAALRAGAIFLWTDESVSSMRNTTVPVLVPHPGCLIFMGESDISHVALYSHVKDNEVYFIDAFSGTGKVEERSYPIGHYKLKEYRSIPAEAFYGI